MTTSQDPNHAADWATWTFLWGQAVERQAERILGAEFEDAQIDVMLFADAIRNVLRGATRVLGSEHPAILAFETQVPDVVHVRNMFQHFDEYVEGKGRRQQGATSGGRSFWMPWHTKVGDNFYCVTIGGHRLEIGPARAASAALVIAAEEGAESYRTERSS